MRCRKDCLLWSLVFFWVMVNVCTVICLLEEINHWTGSLLLRVLSSMLVSKCLIKLDHRGKGTKKFTNQILRVIHAVTVESFKESIQDVSPHKERDDMIRRRRRGGVEQVLNQMMMGQLGKEQKKKKSWVHKTIKSSSPSSDCWPDLLSATARKVSKD